MHLVNRVPVHGAEFLFQVLTEREEKNSVTIASSEPFGGWTETFSGAIIETGTDSYRLATTRARVEEQAKAS
jgi:DNA replication protein DnaC